MIDTLYDLISIDDFDTGDGDDETSGILQITINSDDYDPLMANGISYTDVGFQLYLDKDPWSRLQY